MGTDQKYTYQTYGPGYCVLEQDGRLLKITFDTEPDDPALAILTTQTRMDYIAARAHARNKQSAMSRAIHRAMQPA